MTDTIECPGTVNSLTYCGFLNVEEYPLTSSITVSYFLTFLQVRKTSNRFDIINREFLFYGNDSTANTTHTLLNQRCGTHNISSWEVLEGDQFGVILGAICYLGFCPIQIGLINNGCEEASYFEPNYYDAYKPSISINNTSLVAIKVNLEAKIGKNGNICARISVSNMMALLAGWKIKILVLRYLYSHTLFKLTSFNNF